MLHFTKLFLAVMAVTAPTASLSFGITSRNPSASSVVSFTPSHHRQLKQPHQPSRTSRVENDENDIESDSTSSSLSSSTVMFSRRQVTISSCLFMIPMLLGGVNEGATATINGNGISLPLTPPSAWASGGATAGKYTTIPIAKRRYYGRVEQGVHDFLGLAQHVIDGTAVTKGTVENPDAIYKFFDTTSVVVVAARNQAVNGQCTKADTTCRGKEVRDSRYHDMKTSMYLLANAFRINQQKAPDNLPTVKAAKKFFKEVDAMEVSVQKLLATNQSSNNGNLQQRDTIMAAQQHYIKALDLLDVYLDLVELPPTDSGYYDTEFDTRVGETARIM